MEQEFGYKCRSSKDTPGYVFRGETVIIHISAGCRYTPLMRTAMRAIPNPASPTSVRPAGSVRGLFTENERAHLLQLENI